MAKDSAWDAFIGGAAIVGGAILLYKLLTGAAQQNVPMCPRCRYPLQPGIRNCPNCNMPLNWV